MARIRREHLYPRPLMVRSYIDSVAIWLERKPSNSVIRSLKKSCGHCHVHQKAPWWNAQFRCRVQMHQPRTKALQLLSDHIVEKELSFLINAVDLALDQIAQNPEMLDRLYQFFDEHLVKRWHGRQTNQYVSTTRYRWAQNGVHGIRLETLCVGATRCTSMEALQRFFDALTAQSERQPTVPAPRVTRQRRQQIEAAERRLTKAGM